MFYLLFIKNIKNCFLIIKIINTKYFDNSAHFFITIFPSLGRFPNISGFRFCLVSWAQSQQLNKIDVNPLDNLAALGLGEWTQIGGVGSMNPSGTVKQSVII